MTMISMHYRIFSYLLFSAVLSFAFGSDPEQDVCVDKFCDNSENETQNEPSKYKPSWNRFLSEYQKAQENYQLNQRHTNSNEPIHSDYLHTIKQDLQPFDRIT